MFSLVPKQCFTGYRRTTTRRTSLVVSPLVVAADGSFIICPTVAGQGERLRLSHQRECYETQPADCCSGSLCRCGRQTRICANPCRRPGRVRASPPERHERGGDEEVVRRRARRYGDPNRREPRRGRAVPQRADVHARPGAEGWEQGHELDHIGFVCPTCARPSTGSKQAASAW